MKQPTQRLSTYVVAAALTCLSVMGLAQPASAVTAPRRVSYIAYVGSIGEVWTMNVDGTDRKQITFGGTDRPGGHATKKCDPVISPDGTEIAYAANDGGFYVVSALGELTTPPVAIKTTPNPDPATQEGGRRPTWSRDGSRIMFHYTNGSMRHTAADAQMAVNLWMVERTVNSDGTRGAWGEPRQLTNFVLGAWALEASFSPDATSSFVVYSYRQTPTDPYHLRVMQAPAPLAAGTAPAPTAPGTDLGTNSANALYASWAPSGTQIAFTTACGGGLLSASLTRGSTPDAWSMGPPVQLSRTGACSDIAWSSTAESQIVFGDGSKIYLFDSAKKTRQVSTIGTGSQVGW